MFGIKIIVEERGFLNCSHLCAKLFEKFQVLMFKVCHAFSLVCVNGRHGRKMQDIALKRCSVIAGSGPKA